MAFRSSEAYFSAEKKLSILAVALFSCAVIFFDLKYYLAPLSLGGVLPILENTAGVLIFFCFLSLMWFQAHPFYKVLFQSNASAADFTFSNIRANLPLILPWLILSFVFDLLNGLPLPILHEFLQTTWGDTLSFLLLLVLLVLFFPPLVQRLWSCRPIQGDQRAEIETFCRQQNFSSELLSWPLFEGKAVTAAVMGILPKFRYLLLTPALLAALEKDEIESVLAHEIGHVKHYHLLLYVLLLFSFSLFAEALSEPLLFCFFRNDWFYKLLFNLELSGEKITFYFIAAMFFILMLLYFRFLFGYFIRNFERQADLYVFKAQGNSFPLIRSFEKIAAMSGNIRNKKNWHHFGIGERIDFLLRCEKDRQQIQRHHRKVYLSLVVYFILIALLISALNQLDITQLTKVQQQQYAQDIIHKKLQKEPGNINLLMLQGDLMLEGGQEKKALQSYEQAFSINPLRVELINNLAWLLLTAEDRSLRDPVRALTLARSAVQYKAKGYLLDTLATALWANGMLNQALQIELQAVQIDPEHKAYYQDQIKRFRINSRYIE